LPPSAHAIASRTNDFKLPSAACHAWIHEGVTMIFWVASLPEPGHVPDYSHVQQVAGTVVILGLLLLVTVASIIWYRRGR
jgi:hypothetical protein